jgi:hypothetical protein
LIQRLDFLTFTNTRCEKRRSRIYSKSLERIGQAKKILGLLSERLGAVDISE